METISNVVNTVSQTATKAIWGEQNETAGNEPVSGLQGKGTATDPYDQGNSEDPTDPTTRNETAAKEPVSGLEGKGTATEPFDAGNSADATNTATLPIREKPSTETSDLTSSEPIENNTAGAAATKNLSDTLSKTEGSTVVVHDTVPADKTQPGLAGFAADRTIDPKDDSQAPADASNTATTTSAAVTSSPSTSDNQGAGAAATANLSDTLAKTNVPTSSTVTSPKSSSAVGSEPDTGKGLVEEKTAHKDAAAAASAASTSTEKKQETSPSGEKEKVSKMEKLKEKLHIKKH